VNTSLSVAETHACLEVLYRGLVEIRNCATAGDVARAAAVADALHNLPHLIIRSDKSDWSIRRFRELFLAPLIERYPDLVGLDQPLVALECIDP